MRALITAAANMTGRIVAAIIGGFMTVVTIGAVVTAGIVVTAGPTNGLSSSAAGSVNVGPPPPPVEIIWSMEGDDPRRDPKKILNCYMLCVICVINHF